jgi:hypothetical protein
MVTQIPIPLVVEEAVVVGEEAGEEVHIFLVSSISSKVPAIVIVF